MSSVIHQRDFQRTLAALTETTVLNNLFRTLEDVTTISTALIGVYPNKGSFLHVRRFLRPRPVHSDPYVQNLSLWPFSVKSAY